MLTSPTPPYPPALTHFLHTPSLHTHPSNPHRHPPPHPPTHTQVVPDNYLYARVALIVKDKSSLTEEKLPALAEVLVEEGKAQEVC